MVTRFSETELIQRTDTQNAGVIDSDVLSRAIEDASADIETYLSRYSLPLSPVPRSLNRICCDMARYYLYDDGMPDVVKTRYDDAIKFMTGISRGSIHLGVDSAGDTPVAEDHLIVVESAVTVFGRNDRSYI